MPKNFATNKLRILRNKSTAAIALVLVLTIAATLVALPIANAHDPPWNIPSWMYVAVSPNPVGVGQQVLVVWWHDKIMPTAVGAFGDRWEVTIEVTKPDDSKQTLGPYTADPVGGGYVPYTPDQVGTYTFVAIFPGQTLTGEPVPPANPRGTEYIGDYYMPATSDEVSLTVQQEPILSYPDTPLPEDYWERPIYGENREWWSISGNWLGGGHPANRFNRYSEGPESAHIVWKRPIAFGGLAGGEFSSIAYYEGLSYEALFRTAVIMQGILYYNEHAEMRYSIDTPPLGWYAVDLRTGETLWWKNATMTFGQIYDYESPNAHGTLGYIWKTFGSGPRLRNPPFTWIMYEAFDGGELCTIENVPPGTSAVGPAGSRLVYQYNQNGWVALWNQSRAVWAHWAPFESNYYWNWRPPRGQVVDALKDGYSWNATAPTNLPGGIKWVLDDRIVGATSALLGSYGGYGVGPYSIWCLSLNPATRGQQLWRKDYAAPPVPNATLWFGSVDPEAGIFTMKIKETREWYGYDLDSGDYVWGPTEPHPGLDMYGMYFSAAYGKLFSCGYAGTLYCYNITTGEELWTYTTEPGGFESYYGGHYPLSIGCIADRKIYLYSTEHSPSKPAWRGSKLRCIDTETGKELWKIDTWANNPIVADGYLVTQNCYDNQIYCFGKGRTATTVEAPLTAVPLGSSVVIRGTVTDQSAGAKGTPAIADEDMTEWMEYLYMQKPIPADAKGVEVTLDAVDPNGNWIHIGRATSDISGMFSHMWTPEIEGKYTVIATFEGSDSYWASYAETAIGVSEAPAPVKEPEPEEEPAYTAIDLAIIAAIVVVAILVLYTLWTVRKQRK